MNEKLRVAFFPDSFLEVNGVAMTSKRLVGYAQRRGNPFLCIHAGAATAERTEGSVEYLSLKRSPLAVPMDEGLKYDPLFQRHTNRVLRKLTQFKPDLLHITGLNDVSIVGAYLAWKMQLPLVASWHTNLHEYAARRLTRMFGFLGADKTKPAVELAERKILDGAVLYYKMPKVVLAPNQELLDILTKKSGRKGYIMTRGVDTNVYSPAKRKAHDGILRFGFVGRLRAEKNVRQLAELEKRLTAAGKTNFKFLIVGEGNEREWLEKNMRTAEFTGFLDGERLAQAYADIDIFLFPSETDAFGNVIQEANASGVPAIVTDRGGPKFIVRHGETGFIAKNFEEFVQYALLLTENPEMLAILKRKAREFALSKSWDAVFDHVYEAYAEAVRLAKAGKTARVD